MKHFSFCEEFSEILLYICIGLHVKYVLFWSDFNETSIFSTHFRKINKQQIFMRIRPVGDEFHADGQSYANSCFSAILRMHLETNREVLAR